MYRHILVGTDGSETAADAVRHAATLAASGGSRLAVLSVYDEPDPAEAKSVQKDVPEELQWTVTGVAQAEERASEGTVIERQLGADAHSRVERGEAADMIIKVLEAGDFDLVVVGSRGLSSPTRFILGNVPDAISHHAPCDVAIVHTAD